MKECFKCGANETEAILIRAISKEGLVYICNRCQIKERLPLIKEGGKVDNVQQKMSVRQRLEIMAGVKHKEEPSRTIQHMGEEIHLKDIVEENFQKKVKEADKKVYPELIPNFHWIVMRKRRLAKLTQSELAGKIAEPVSAIQALERGSLPSDYLPLVRKIENFFRIFLLKEPKREFVPEKDISSESKVPSGVTINDLRKLHSEEVSKKKGFWQKFSKKDKDIYEDSSEEISDNKKNEDNEKDEDNLSPEEIDKIIFQRD